MKHKFDWFGLFLALGELLVGILLLMSPGGFTAGIIVAAGVLLCILGIKDLIGFFREEPQVAAGTDGFMMGALCLFGGIFCAFAANWVAVELGIVSRIYGAVVLLTGLWKLQNTVNMLRLKFQKWHITGISSALALISAIILMFNPFNDVEGLGIFVAVSLLVQAAMDLVAAFVGKPAIASKEKDADEDESAETEKVKVKVKEKKKEA